MALATNDIDAIEMAAAKPCWRLRRHFDLVMVLGIMLLGVDWRLACIALLPSP